MVNFIRIFLLSPFISSLFPLCCGRILLLWMKWMCAMRNQPPMEFVLFLQLVWVGCVHCLCCFWPPEAKIFLPPIPFHSIDFTLLHPLSKNNYCIFPSKPLHPICFDSNFLTNFSQFLVLSHILFIHSRRLILKNHFLMFIGNASFLAFCSPPILFLFLHPTNCSNHQQ